MNSGSMMLEKTANSPAVNARISISRCVALLLFRFRFSRLTRSQLAKLVDT